MRMVVVVLGVIILLMGIAWALQGAYLLPATFMRGWEWVGIGTAVVIGGLLVALLGFRMGSPTKSS